jgi:hypothetical protein
VPTLTWSKRQIPDWTGLSCDSLMSSMFIASKRFAFTRDLRSFDLPRGPFHTRQSVRNRGSRKRIERIDSSWPSGPWNVELKAQCWRCTEGQVSGVKHSFRSCCLTQQCYRTKFPVTCSFFTVLARMRSGEGDGA